MPDSLKRVEIPSEILSELDWDTGGYLIRYRYVSENRNTTSHWSPVYQAIVPDFEKVEGEFSRTLGEGGSTVVTAAWDDAYSRPFYDIFVAQRDSVLYGDEFEFDGDMFHFHGTSSTHDYSFVERSGTTSTRVIVQPAANLKKIKDGFIIYDSDNPLVQES
jgi:hypothetical protein